MANPNFAVCDFRYPDALLNRILAGCKTGDEWWGRHPVLPVEVSNLGNVRGVRGFVLKPYLHDGRYLAVDICGRRHVRIHTLVLETFIGPRPDDMEACHWDGVKVNVKLDNLRWDTRSANRHDARRHRAEAAAAQQRLDINRKLVILEKLEQLAQ
jgi:hypothetical protein